MCGGVPKPDIPDIPGGSRREIRCTADTTRFAFCALHNVSTSYHSLPLAILLSPETRVRPACCALPGPRSSWGEAQRLILSAHLCDRNPLRFPSLCGRDGRLRFCAFRALSFRAGRRPVLPPGPSAIKSSAPIQRSSIPADGFVEDPHRPAIFLEEPPRCDFAAS